jgi:hypothetical protein
MRRDREACIHEAGHATERAVRENLQLVAAHWRVADLLAGLAWLRPLFGVKEPAGSPELGDRTRPT